MTVLIATRDDELLERCRAAIRAELEFEVVRDEAGLLGRAGVPEPSLVLFDAELVAPPLVPKVARIVAANPEARVVVMTEHFDENEELGFFKAGAKGCCRRSVDPDSLRQILTVTYDGGVWITRSLLPRILAELQRYARVPRAAADPGGADVRLGELTRREREIVRLIGSGASNKQVANALAISDRTVKGHLSHIFSKLEVTDRLNLALYAEGRRR